MQLFTTPREDGYYFPAEFSPQRAMWLSWPHKEASWPGKLGSIYPIYAQFAAIIAEHQQVNILVCDSAMKILATDFLLKANGNMSHIHFMIIETNDAWCRDHGPAFLKHNTTGAKAIVDWGYNAWGGKYPPFDLDDVVPRRIAARLNLPFYLPGIIMEGGAVDFNGEGTLLTTTSCLLNPNRNPHLTKRQIEQFLIDYYGVNHILWLGEGIVGDDTDGHIDDMTRFVDAQTVVTVVESNVSDENYDILRNNLKTLSGLRLADGRPLNIIELPMPKPVIYEGQRLPASYANFYIGNKHVVVPTFRDDRNDVKALDILQRCFPERKVVGLDSTDIIWGLGSFHCLSQQEPE